MKVIYSILAFIFALFAILQWNDPDGLLWMGIYGYPALLFILSLLKIRRKVLFYIGIIAFLTGMIFLVPDVMAWIKMGTPSLTGSMQAESMYIEKVREFFGLLVCLSAMIYLLFSPGIRK